MLSSKSRARQRAPSLIVDLYLSRDYSSNSPKNVQMCTSDLLIQLLEEIPTIPTTIIDILLAQFLPKNVKQKPAAYQLAIAVCSSSSDKLQRFVCQYFAEVIMSSVDEGGSDSDEDDDPRKGKKGGKSGSNELPPAIITAHGLIRQINCSVPSLLTNVIPQIEEELTAEKAEYRKLATEVLGAMLGEEIGQGDLAHNYPGTWREWLKRCKDKSPGVKIAMAQSVCKIWQQHPECGADIESKSLSNSPPSSETDELPVQKLWEVSYWIQTTKSDQQPAVSLKISLMRQLRTMLRRSYW